MLPGTDDGAIAGGMAVASYIRRRLPNAFTVLAGPEPPDALGFRSDTLQVLWNDSSDRWTDSGQHYHAESDEIFIVLKGALEFEVGDERFTLDAGECCIFPAEVPHAVVAVHPPISHLVIRAPAVQDKVYAGSERGAP